MIVFAYIVLAVCLVFGSAFVLPRTAKAPKLPKGFKPRTNEDDSNGS